VARTATRKIERIGPAFKRWIALAALSAATAVALGGCAYFVPTVKLEREDQAKWYAQDIPVPEGFALDREATRIHDRLGSRELKLIYRRGSYIDTDRTIEFYKEAFVQRGWKLEFVTGMDRTNLIFFKDDEECRVTIDRDFTSAYVWACIEVETKDPNCANPIVARKQ
jgi:hypothetical protein